jgi:hypothetical protein
MSSSQQCSNQDESWTHITTNDANLAPSPTPSTKTTMDCEVQTDKSELGTQAPTIHGPDTFQWSVLLSKFCGLLLILALIRELPRLRTESNIHPAVHCLSNGGINTVMVTIATTVTATKTTTLVSTPTAMPSQSDSEKQRDADHWEWPWKKAESIMRDPQFLDLAEKMRRSNSAFLKHVDAYINAKKTATITQTKTITAAPTSTSTSTPDRLSALLKGGLGRALNDILSGIDGGVTVMRVGRSVHLIAKEKDGKPSKKAEDFVDEDDGGKFLKLRFPEDYEEFIDALRNDDK